MGIVGDLLRSAGHPSEIAAMLRLKFGPQRLVRKDYGGEPLERLAERLGDDDFCTAALNRVSRSFAAVINSLEPSLVTPVAIFYLVLRGLDSVEDDMDFPLEKRIPLLKTFYKHLEDPDWSIEGVGDAHDYRVLLANFGKVTRVYLRLSKPFRDVISDSCRRMGEGMAKYAVGSATIRTVEEYDEYCFYVAGLVGHALSDIFAASGVEEASLASEHGLSRACGLFLQHVNLARDFREDFEVGRVWWPTDVWGKHADSLQFFYDQPAHPKSVATINELSTYALGFAPDVLVYLGRLRHPDVFRFCAIPQVMAIATLDVLYNSPLEKNLKMRKGLAARYMLEVRTMDDVRDVFRTHALSIRDRVRDSDPSAERTRKILARIVEACGEPKPRPASGAAKIATAVAVAAVGYTVLSTAGVV